jgi:T5SS/PEP-CTERM-associated repeat protein/autotransporter-associated beta strand protein
LAALGWLISAGPLAAQTTANWNPVFGVGGSSDWFNFINWSTLAVPDSSTDVVIDLGTGYDQPIISGNYAEANDVIVGNTTDSDSTTLLTIEAGWTLETTGNFDLGVQAGSFGATDVDGAGSLLSLAGFLTVGDAGTGNLSITNGGNVTVNGEDGDNVGAYIGSQTGAIGTVTVSGSEAGDNSTLDVTTGALYVGSSGNGTLNISDGGNVSVDAASALVGFIGNGTLTVDGAGSVFNEASILFVGVFGNGNLSITSGGNVSVASYVSLGDQSGGSGTVTVDSSGGAGSVLNDAGSLYVGNVGNGTLTITAGGNVSTGSDIYVGDSSGAFGCITVDSSGGAGSVLNVGGNLEVGESGTGNLSVTTGGNVSVAGQFNVGDQSGAVGSANVDGAGSLLSVAGFATVGNAGTGTLTIADGGIVSASSFVMLAQQSGSNGTVNLNAGGTLQVGGVNGIQAGAGTASFNLAGGNVQVIGSDLTTSVDAILANATTSSIDTNGFNATWTGELSGEGALKKIGLGTLNLTAMNTYIGGTTVAAGTLELGYVANCSAVGTGPLAVDAGATLSGNGNVTGDATISGNLSPGDGPGLITFESNLTLNSGSSTNLALAGNTSPGVNYDTINVIGNLLTGGTLNVTLASFSPSQGDTFNLFTVNGTITGTFATLELPSLGGSLTWGTSSLYTLGEISVVPEPAEDALLLGAGLMAWAVWRRRR